MPEVLYEAVVEVDERLVLHQEGCQVFDSGQRVTGESCSQAQGAERGEEELDGASGVQMWTLPPPGLTGEAVVVKQPVDLVALRVELEALVARGIRSLAVVLLHSYL